MSPPRRMQTPQIYQDPMPHGRHTTISSFPLPPTYDVFGPGGPLSELPHNIPLPPAISHAQVMPPPPQGHFPMTDSLYKKQSPLMPLPPNQRLLKPVPGHMTMYHTPAQFDKENVFTPEMMGQTSIYTQKSMIKASFTPHASTPSADRPVSRKQKKNSISEISSLPSAVPEPNDLPFVEDDGTKPAFSYSQLIGMAILRSDNRRLTLAQIYKWISDSFAFYRTQETGWQNSIRHNLSLNKAFTKQDRPKDDPGKGHYWAIQPGSEAQFLKDKGKAGNANSALSSSQSKRPSTAQSTSSQTAFKNLDSSKFPEDELSSDATIPASDPAVHEGVAPAHAMPPPLKHLRSSPPPTDLHSSPPAISSLRERTPPADHQFAVPSNRNNGGRKRKLSNLQTGLGDSGYYSSIESSAVRNPRPLMTSEADEPPSRKRGRAEEEIARIRSSSYDSPSKGRTNPTILVSSSPYLGDSGPFTPGVFFKRPMKPPASVSPNTNLKRHRESVFQLLGSPDNSALTTFDQSFEPLLPNMFAADINDAAWLSMLEESPIRSANRPRLERANTTTGVLSDVTGFSYGNGRYLSPAKMPYQQSPLRLGSPVKLPAATLLFDERKLSGRLFEKQVESAGGNEENEDFAFALNLPSDDSETIDITQGFHKIGSPSTLAASQGAMQPPSQAFAFPVYPGADEHQSPTKARKPPGLSRRSTFTL